MTSKETMIKSAKKLKQNNMILVKNILKIENIKRILILNNEQAFSDFIKIPFEEIDVLIDNRTYREKDFFEDLNNILNEKDSALKTEKKRIFLNKFKIPKNLNHYFPKELNDTQIKLSNCIIFANFGLINSSIQKNLPEVIQTDDSTLKVLESFIKSLYSFDLNKKVLITTYITLRIKSILYKINLDYFKNYKKANDFYSDFLFPVQLPENTANQFMTVFEELNFTEDLLKIDQDILSNIYLKKINLGTLLNIISRGLNIYKVAGKKLDLSGLRDSFLEKFEKYNPVLYEKVKSNSDSKFTIIRIIFELISLNKHNDSELLSINLAERNIDSDLENNGFNEKINSEDIKKDIRKIFYNFILEKSLENQTFKTNIFKNLSKEEKINFLTLLLEKHNSKNFIRINKSFLFYDNLLDLFSEYNFDTLSIPRNLIKKKEKNLIEEVKDYLKKDYQFV